MSEFGGDVPAADDDHGLWQLGQPHHGVGGLEVHRVQPRQIRDHRTTAGRDHHPVGGNGVCRADVQLPRPDEARAGVEDRDIIASLPMPSTLSGHGINPVEDPIPNLEPMDALEIQIHPEPGRLHCRGCQIGRMNEHLAGNAANVEARPAERAHFDQSHV